MKRRLSIWLALCLLCLYGAALGEETVVEYAKARGMNIMELTAGLTEIYGYTQEEADQFLCSVTETESTLEYVLYPAEHPNWRYTHVLNRKNGACEDDLSPFSGTNPPGYEGWLRAILQRAAEESWFENWDEAAMTALYDQMTQWEFRRSARLEAGLGQKNLTAAEAVQEMFVSTFGDELSWTEPVREWRDEVLTQHGLTRETISTAPVQGVQRWQAEGRITGKMTVVEFAGQLPEELQSLYVNEPHLAGWSCLSGAMRLPETAGRSALIAFGRGEERLLAMAVEMEDELHLLPVGEQALLPGRAFSIHYDPQKSLYSIEYPLDENGEETECFRVLPAAVQRSGEERRILCIIKDYRRVNQKTLEGFVLESLEYESAAEGNWRATVYRPGKPTESRDFDLNLPHWLDDQSAADFPRSIEECEQLAEAGSGIPEGYAVCRGVHLRQKTSSRSKDLGDMKNGTLVRVLETVPGDPWPWARVQVGSLEGYMCNLYVSYEGSTNDTPVSQIVPLPVAETLCETALKESTALLGGTVAQLPVGTRMHVLCEYDGWLYVCVPRNEPGWLMDVDGQYGFVKAANVRTAASFVQLDWRMESSDQ